MDRIAELVGTRKCRVPGWHHSRKAGREVKHDLALAVVECQRPTHVHGRPAALQPCRRRADMEPPAMRTIGFRSNVLFIIAAAVGLVAALGRPWYAPAFVPSGEEARIGDVQGPVEGFFLRLGREFADDGGTKGWDAFTSTDMILMALVAITVVSAIAALIPGIERHAREVVRLGALAMLGIVVVKLVNTPDG